ncbi:MAG TPA: hypothetical protein VNW46_10825 [Gemmatimonadaceae bacterium]|nr:hypothetical protein [Gemmatimonadaceae bacterium]
MVRRLLPACAGSLLLLLPVVSCAIWRSEGVGVKADHAGASATLNGIRFEARNNGVPSWGPVVTQVRITVTNTLAHDTTVTFLTGNCAALMRVYHKPDRSDTPLYDATVGAECYVPEMRSKLAPNGSVELVSAPDGPGIELRSGRYYLTVLVTPVAPKGAEEEPARIEIPAGEIDVFRP